MILILRMGITWRSDLIVSNMISLIQRKEGGYMDKQSIEKTNTLFVNAVKRRDAEGMASCYTDDAKIVAPNGPIISGKQAIRDFWQGALDMGVQWVVLETLSLEDRGDVALEIGAWSREVKPKDGQPRQEEGKYAVFCKKQADGSCKWAVDIYN